MISVKEGEYLVRISVSFRGERLSLTDIANARVEHGQAARLDMEFRGSTGIRGRFRAPDKRLAWLVQVEDASARVASLAESDRLRATAWKLERTGRYSIEGLAPGTYRVTAKCLRNDEKRTSIMQQSKTITLKDGETA